MPGGWCNSGYLFFRDDFHVAASAKDVDADGFGVSLERDVDDGVAYAEIADFYALEGFGERGVIELEPRILCGDCQTETGLQGHEDGSGAPGLGRAGDWIEGRSLSRAARESADQFGETAQIDEEG